MSSSPRLYPLLSAAYRPLTVTIDAINEHGEVVPTAIAGEHPLTIYVDKREIVTLMTLGAAVSYTHLDVYKRQDQGRYRQVAGSA